MAVVFHVRLANALEFQVRVPIPEEPFQVRVVTPGVRVAKPCAPGVRVPTPGVFCPRATEEGALPNRVVGEPVVGVDMRVVGVDPMKFLFPDIRELFMANAVDREPVAMPSRLFTSVL